MRVPVYLAIAQWALLATLCMLVIVMYRQLGMAFTRPKQEALGPAVGTEAASVQYTRVSDGAIENFIPRGKPTLLAFVDATCPSCERLVGAMGEAQVRRELDGFRVLLLVSDPPNYLQISKVFRETRFEIGRLRDRMTVEAYSANATPLLVAIDKTGIVRSAGPAVHVSEVVDFARASLVTDSTTRSLDPFISTPAELTSEMVSGPR